MDAPDAPPFCKVFLVFQTSKLQFYIRPCLRFAAGPDEIR